MSSRLKTPIKIQNLYSVYSLANCKAQPHNLDAYYKPLF